MIISKNIVPNKEWILEDEQGKIGSISKKKKGYDFLRKGQKFEFKNLNEIKKELGIQTLENSNPSPCVEEKYEIYDYPCSSKPFNPLYNIRKKLPLFSKSNKSKSQYCAGYYLVKFRKGWVKSFCPKLITIERYQHHGPFKTDTDTKLFLNKINKI
jgi:hypothetical protein